MISDDMLEVDEYKFKHFPAKWLGQSENVVNRKKTIHDIKLVRLHIIIIITESKGNLTG